MDVQQNETNKVTFECLKTACCSHPFIHRKLFHGFNNITILEKKMISYIFKGCRKGYNVCLEIGSLKTRTRNGCRLFDDKHFSYQLLVTIEKCHYYPIGLRFVFGIKTLEFTWIEINSIFIPLLRRNMNWFKLEINRNQYISVSIRSISIGIWMYLVLGHDYRAEAQMKDAC